METLGAGVIMDKEELFIGAVVVNTQVPEDLRYKNSIIIDFICGDFVHVRYLNDTGRDVIKKVPIDYFLVHWDLSWRVD